MIQLRSLAWFSFALFSCAGLADDKSSGAVEPPSAKMQALKKSMELLDDKRPLRIGDTIELWLVEDHDKVYRLRVFDDGTMPVPYTGKISAVGRTCKQLAYNLKRELERDGKYFNRVTVLIVLMTC